MRASGRARPWVSAIVPAAGSGRRMGLKTKKPFLRLGGVPLVLHALRTLDGCSLVDEIIIASERSCIERFKKLVRRYSVKKVAAIVRGGRERGDSVKNCLSRVNPQCDIVLIHDGARPLLSDKTVRDSIRYGCIYGGCIVALCESDTVKISDKNLFVKKTLDRKYVYRAQTPQVFKRSMLEKAYKLGAAGSATDDARLIEMSGGRVKILQGTGRNIKITTRDDLKIAEALL